ncbi:MAG TPA: UvrD-helicase domain-containing protein [Frankiaceae bacterium]|jgi:superfamily I DNA/RNA helicase|nr:UvrD-helicase domain-containing protein [Frankiaceae bacterium]
MTRLSTEQQSIHDAAVNPAFRAWLLLVQAGAGTGKTTALVAAVRAWLRAHPGQRAVLVTFSRAATDELTARLTDLADRVTITTFDALLRRRISRANPRAEYIGTLADQKLLHDALRDTYGAVLPSLLPGGLKSGIATLQRAANTGATLHPDYADVLAAAWGRWADVKRTRSLYSSGDMRRWLRHNVDDLINWVTRNGGLLVVDEAQDCEAAEAEFLARAAACPRLDRVLIAHDPNQNVNGFRGAVRSLHETLHGHGAPITTFDLTVNRRSTRPIVDACRTLLTEQARPVLVTVDPTRETGPLPRLVIADGEKRMLTDLAAALHACKVTSHGTATVRPSHTARERLGPPADLTPEQMFIVVRRNRDAEALVRALADAGIAAIQHSAKKNPFDGEMLALLWAWCAPTLADQTGGHDPTGSWALSTLVTAMASRYGGAARAAERREYLDRVVATIYERAAASTPFPETRAACVTFVAALCTDWTVHIPQGVRDDLQNVLDLLYRWEELDQANAPAAVRVERLLRFFPKWRTTPVRGATTKGQRRAGRDAWHPAARHLANAPNGADALDRHVRQMIALGGNHAPGRSLDAFRTWAAGIFGGQPVIVMTAHTAKGREADHVIVAYADAGTWPLDYTDTGITDTDEDDLADNETCVIYVAMSRARLTLTLLSSGEPTPYVDPESLAWHVC